jgi:hypothetical protein
MKRQDEDSVANCADCKLSKITMCDKHLISVNIGLRNKMVKNKVGKKEMKVLTDGRRKRKNR